MWDTNMVGSAAPKAVRTGTTLTYSCATSNAHLAFAFDLRCNQLLVSGVLGDFAFQSGWLEVDVRLLSVGMAPRILGELVRWQALVTMPSTTPQKCLTTMYQISVTYDLIEEVIEEF